MDAVFEEQVRQRAYQIWVDLGRVDGQAHDNWVAAERDLRAQPAKPKIARTAIAKAKPVASKAAKPIVVKAAIAKVTKPKKARIAEPNSASA